MGEEKKKDENDDDTGEVRTCKWGQLEVNYDAIYSSIGQDSELEETMEEGKGNEDEEAEKKVEEEVKTNDDNNDDTGEIKVSKWGRQEVNYDAIYSSIGQDEEMEEIMEVGRKEEVEDLDKEKEEEEKKKDETAVNTGEMKVSKWGRQDINYDAIYS